MRGGLGFCGRCSSLSAIRNLGFSPIVTFVDYDPRVSSSMDIRNANEEVVVDVCSQTFQVRRRVRLILLLAAMVSIISIKKDWIPALDSVLKGFISWRYLYFAGSFYSRKNV